MKNKSHSSSRRAVVLLSGGLDSATVLYWARHKGYDCHCLVADYGQRHRKELKCARAVAAAAGCPVTVLPIQFPWGGSSLLDHAQPLPAEKPEPRGTQLPSTYVPGRNTIFIAFALSFAETIGCTTVFIGANAVDYSGYPDCRPKYYAAWRTLLSALGTGIRVQVPLLRLNKSRIIRLGTALGVPYQHTWSCYAGGKYPCGTCDSCRFRAKGFAEAGMPDPALLKR
jgi:7-cyano-7-deazaguanine synthase